MTSTLEQQTIRKVALRLLPFIGLLYFVSFLDRVNVGFAALTMNKELGFSAYLYGWGAGIFFFGYLLFEVPSNVILEKVGARVWIARIMITWGLISAGMAFISGPVSFLVLRFLLGVAEAGFFPGMIYYISFWFPAEQRAKIFGWFIFAIPVSSVLGAPLSGWLLGFDGVGGLSGWQWLFIVEGLPAVFLGVVVLFYMTDRPADAHWLERDEREWLVQTMEREKRAIQSAHGYSLGKALASPRVLALSLVYFGLVLGLYGIGFWLPQLVKGFGLSNLAVGFVTAIPYLVAAIGMVLWAYHSDRRGERIWHVAIAGFVGGAGMIAAAYIPSNVLGMVALSFAIWGIYAALTPFWTLPTAFLSGTAAAGGIALINSLGNAGGFVGPYVVGAIKDATGSLNMALVVLGLALIGAGLVTLAIGAGMRRTAATAARAEGSA
jgi:ACS family tartrate transporter-like MFS transporter